MKIKKQNLIVRKNLKENIQSGIQKGALVKHKKNKKIGIVLKKSNIHFDYYHVFISGKKEEWHTCNIINIYNYLKRNII
jgi:hypothetical protein